MKNAIRELVKKIYTDFGKDYEGQCEDEIRNIVWEIESLIDMKIPYFGQDE